MMASPSDLSLDCKPQMLLKPSMGDQQIDQTQKLEDFLARLEEERLKIDAFKRELPLCMQLLINAMDASRQQLLSYRANQGTTRPVLEEFIPLKHGSRPQESEHTANNMSDNKANWMTSAQLWSQASDHSTKQHQHSTTTQPPAEASDGALCVSPKLALDSKHRNGGAFLPFSKDKNSCPSPNPLRALPELALAPTDKDMEEDKKNLEIDNSIKGSNGIEHGKVSSSQAECQSTVTSNTAANTTNTNATNNTQTHRKARRCWSPDLHRRFVNALQMLGGSQVATPKQIRELMKVDGLTNDEVKSHLQKYRLHTRRPSASPQAAASAAPQLVVLGGIWVPPEYAAAAHGGAPPTLYSAHPTTHASAHYCPPPVPQEFYPAPALPQTGHHQLHHHQLIHHHQLHMYKPTSHVHSSPESDARGNGGRSESIEDGKSESSSWKADSGGENGGARKGLVLREDHGDDSNGSEITLKF